MLAGVLLSQVLAGFFTQFYLRNYRPSIFKNYSYLVTGTFDGASLLVAFILTFAVFGVSGPAIPLPEWWGNDEGGDYDLVLLRSRIPGWQDSGLCCMGG
jgi:hypothetical protein